MMRAPIGNSDHWTTWINYIEQALRDRDETLKRPSPNPGYQPQFWFNACTFGLQSTLMQYSRGDPICLLPKNIERLLISWERSNKRITEVEISEGYTPIRCWNFSFSNLNYYNFCFWLVGLALSLDIPDEQWQRLLVLIGNEGQDILLDRIIATRQPGRKIGTSLLHPKPYARLLRAIDAAPVKQPALLREFVDHWYVELKRKRDEELWWYVFGDPVIHPLEMGSYFGRWCIEAVAAVKAFGLDDSLCLGHEHYPGDLLRPGGPTTHVARPESKSTRRFDWRLLDPHWSFPGLAPVRNWIARLAHR